MCIFIVLQTLNSAYPDNAIDWLHFFGLNFILKSFMTQNGVFKIYFLLTLKYFSQKLCVGRYIISANRKGLKRIYNIFFL